MPDMLEILMGNPLQLQCADAEPHDRQHQWKNRLGVGLENCGRENGNYIGKSFSC
jgi:hypothetical protein